MIFIGTRVTENGEMLILTGILLFTRQNCSLLREFFHMIGETMAEKILLVLASTQEDGYVAGAWNCIGSHALFGRNWGKKRRYECKNLHFELCYYQVKTPLVNA